MSEPHPLPQLQDLAPSPRGGLSRDVGLRMLFSAIGIDEAPVHIGRFEVRDRLGQGAMGTVYRAWDPELEREVALKVLDATVNEAEADAALQEARALARLAHPHVVAVYELGVENDQVFVAMEYVPGRTVGEFVAETGPAADAVIELFAQAGKGLHAAHEAGLIHRDIKPDNLLVSEDGRVRVADFGLACLADNEAAEVAGTPQFMAPEVVVAGRASVASDVYAFCASLWRLLAPDAELRDPDAPMPEAVRTALTRGLDSDPAKRWASMAPLLDVLAPPPPVAKVSRHRTLLLDRVQRLWIEGVLHVALAEGPVLTVPMSDASQEVESPFDVPTDQGTLRDRLEAGQGSLLILGEPGAGKTTALLQLAETLIAEARADARAPAPVVLALASLGAHKGTPAEWVEDELVAKYGLPRPSVHKWLAAGELILLLDGLDEVAVGRRSAVLAALNDLRSAAGLSVVVSCRSSDYRNLPETLRLGAAVCLDPLPPEVVRAHVRSSSVYASLAPDLRTPLTLRLLESLRVELPEEGPLPWLYRRFLDHALDDLPRDEARDLEDGLAFLAAGMHRDDRSELWLEELAPDWLFPDARRYATKALALAMLMAIALVINVGVGVAVEGDALSGVLFAGVSVSSVLVLGGGFRMQRVERLRFSWGRLARLAPLSLVVGLVLGALYGMFYVLWSNVIFGGVCGLVIAVTVAFEPALTESSVRPNAGMRQSVRNGLGIGLLAAALGGVAIGYVAVPLVLPYLEPPATLIELDNPQLSAAALAGPLLGTIAGMLRGGWTVLQHIAVRLVLAWTTPLPLALVPMLDESVDRALMRRIGGGYLFPHRTLQTYLASR